MMQDEKNFRLFTVARRISQAMWLVIFVFLVLEMRLDASSFSVEPELVASVTWLFELDPFVSITAAIAGRTIPSALFIGLGVLLFTGVFGRFFCGWFCPMGTLNHYASNLFAKPLVRYTPKLSRLKYLVLAVSLALTVFAVNPSGVIDPIALFVRGMGMVVIPAFAAFMDGVSGLLGFIGMDGTGRALSSFMQVSVFGMQEHHFVQAAPIGAVFLIIIALNALVPRFWCRGLCPLGALLGLASRFSVFRVRSNDACTACGGCGTSCKAGAVENFGSTVKVQPGECMMLGDCLTACGGAQMSIGFAKPNPARTTADPDRRRLAFSIAGGLAAAPLLRLGFDEGRVSPSLIRPPGAVAEKKFLATCTRCGACMKVCPTNFLQPALFEARLEGLWSPVGVARFGWCEYSCTLCGQVCPTGAIQELMLEKKQNTVIGTAFIDVNRCLPYAFGRECIVCEEHCPTAPKAIQFKVESVTLPDGSRKDIRKPIIDLDECIGCGICETKCPVVDKPAVRVTSVGESRSEKNRMVVPAGDDSPY